MKLSTQAFVMTTYAQPLFPHQLLFDGPMLNTLITGCIRKAEGAQVAIKVGSWRHSKTVCPYSPVFLDGRCQYHISFLIKEFIWDSTKMPLVEVACGVYLNQSLSQNYPTPSHFMDITDWLQPIWDCMQLLPLYPFTQLTFHYHNLGLFVPCLAQTAHHDIVFYYWTPKGEEQNLLIPKHSFLRQTKLTQT